MIYVNILTSIIITLYYSFLQSLNYTKHDLKPAFKKKEWGFDTETSCLRKQTRAEDKCLSIHSVGCGDDRCILL